MPHVQLSTHPGWHPPDTLDNGAHVAASFQGFMAKGSTRLAVQFGPVQASTWGPGRRKPPALTTATWLTTHKS